MDEPRLRLVEGSSAVQTRHPTHPAEFGGLDSTALRERFLVGDLFADGEVRLTYSHHDRIVIGGAGPPGPPPTPPGPPPPRAPHLLHPPGHAPPCPPRPRRGGGRGAQNHPDAPPPPHLCQGHPG